jgi:MscS family membrane protein
MLLLVSGVTWLLYILIDSAHDMLAKITTKTESNLDDMVLGLMTGVTKLLLFLAAAIVTADIFGLPYGTVVAGIGVSGLAFAIASRDLIANLFGSAIIASDRPFQRGDFISVGDHAGHGRARRPSLDAGASFGRFGRHHPQQRDHDGSRP